LWLVLIKSEQLANVAMKDPGQMEKDLGIGDALSAFKTANSALAYLDITDTFQLVSEACLCKVVCCAQDPQFQGELFHVAQVII